MSSTLTSDGSLDINCNYDRKGRLSLTGYTGFGQLTGDINFYTDKSVYYTYDAGGNITSRQTYDGIWSNRNEFLAWPYNRLGYKNCGGNRIMFTVNVQNDGYVHCKSSFYSAHDALSRDFVYTVTKGVNKLSGEIDSGIWAISYMLSMYKYRSKDFVLFDPPVVTVNNETLSLMELSELSCYMDKIYPLFSTGKSVKKLITQGLKHSKLNCSADDVKELFQLDSERFERPLTQVGNEVFRAMAAIGYSYKKEMFCFPWLSYKRFEGYHRNISGLLDILENLNKTVVLPLGAK